MSLTLLTDTYITQTDATSYLGSVYLSTDAKLIAWNALTSDNKDVLLRKAAKLIDRQPLIGYKSTSTQTMEFPRIIYTNSRIYDDNIFLDSDWYDPNTVPTNVGYAQAEIALELAQGTSDNTERADLRSQGVTSFSLGSLSETYGGSVNKIISEEAKQLLAPYLGGGFRIA